VLVLSSAWVGVRAYLAKGELEKTQPLISQIQQEITQDDGAAAQKTAILLVARSSSAATLTSDPIWRAFELLPWIGVNLSAVRDIAGAVNDVSANVVEPLTYIANGIGAADFKPSGGTLNLKPFTDAQPALKVAAAAMQASSQRVKAIDTKRTIPVITDAAQRFEILLTKADAEVGALNRAAQLLPSMLGASGPKNYILMFQNPAELRSAGGIPGALALIHAENGRIELTAQASGNSFGEFPTPVLPLSNDTRGLFGDITATYMQDVTLTPDFAVSAPLAREMWKLRFGVEVDGVMSVDPITLSYLLEATGPVTLPSGDFITSKNAVKLLLTDVYERFPQGADQDAFFASTASAVFQAVVNGTGNPLDLIKALVRGGDERRILLWSADTEEQGLLASTTLAGGLPVSHEQTNIFGIYLNDGTGAKMGGYLDVQVALGQVTCRQDARPEYVVDVELTNTAPLDSDSSLPRLITGGGAFGVKPGNIKTVVNVLAPEPMLNMGMTRDGDETPFHPTSLNGYPVSAVSVELAPEESTVLRFKWLGDKPFQGELGAEITPQINTNATQQVEMTCESGLE
jgi:hypothetical protein